MTTEWHLVMPGKVRYDCEACRRQSLRIHQFFHAAQDGPTTWELVDDVKWKELESMGLYSRYLEPLQPIRTMKTSLQCCGAENTRFFSHAWQRLWLQDGVRGTGECWSFSRTEVEAVFTISCCGGEGGWYLVNHEGKPTLSQYCDTTWLVSDGYEGAISISVFATDGCLVLSHANGQVTLQSEHRGEGELWRLAEVGSQ